MAQVAGKLGISENSLYGWMADYKESGKQAFPGSGQLRPEVKALREVQKRIRELEEENEILKRPCTTLQKTGADQYVHP